MVETSAWVNQTPNPDSFEMVASSSNNCINFLKLFLGGLFNPGKIWKNGQTKTIKCWSFLPSVVTWILMSVSPWFFWCPLKNPKKPECDQTKFHKFSVAFNKKSVKKVPGVDCNHPKNRSRPWWLPWESSLVTSALLSNEKKGPWLFRVY